MKNFRCWCRCLIVFATLIVTSVAFCQAPNTCTPAPSGLVAWWRAESNFVDSINGNVGAPLGSVTFAPGEFGTGFDFASPNVGISVPASASLNLSTNSGVTLEAWINPSAVNNANQWLVGWKDLVSNTYGVHMALSQNGPAGCLFGNIKDTFNGNHVWTTSMSPVTNGGFQHVALTYDQTSGIATLYYNGAVAAEANLGSFTPDTTEGMSLGSRASPNSEDTNFLGVLDEVSVYNRALSQGEIQSIYDAGSSGKCFVPVPPMIAAQPTDETVAVGGTASFSVSASGSPTLMYQWFSGSGSIDGATNATLTLSDVTLSEAGSYYVTVSNPYGSTNSASAALTVGNPPPPPSCTPASSGIVAWWRAESNTVDSINGNNGVFVGTESYAPGKVGAAFNFNGSSYVEVPDSPTLRFTNGMTVEAWVNLNRYTGNATEILSKYAALSLNANSYTFSVEGANTAPTHRAYFTVVGTNYVSLQLFSSTDIPTNQWVHIAGTYDGATVKIYVNGALSASAPFTNEIWPGTQPLSIGCSIDGGPVSLFNGQIDEVSLYARALSASEIAVIYDAGSAGKCVVPEPPSITGQPTHETVPVGGTASFTVTAVGSPPLTYQWYGGSASISGATNSTLTLSNVQFSATGSYYVTVSNPYGSTNSTLAMLVVTNLPSSCLPAPSGIISWWPAEGNANDIVGGNNGTIIGGVDFVPGEVGQAFYFSNTNSYISVPASPSLNVGLGGGFTIETWIAPADVSVEHPLAEWTPTNGVVGTHFWIDVPDLGGGTGSVFASLIDTANNAHWISSPSGLVQTNVFQHVAVTYDKASGNAVLYYNGAAVASINLGSVTLNTTGPLLIGHRQSTGENYLGRLDEMTLYGRALSASEIAAIYNAGSAGKCSSSNGVAPMITGQPTNETVEVDGTASFSVSTTGTPPLAYQWHNGSASITGATNSTLTLSNVQLNATGNYYVTVSNPYGSTNSATATLTVTNPPSSCVPAPSGIISWWPAEGNANDIVGGNNGTIIGGVDFVPGEVGQAFYFSDTNSYISVPPSPSLNVGQGSGFTIETWIAPADVAAEHPLAEWTSNGVSATQFWISVPVPGGGAGSVFASLYDTANNPHWITSVSGLVQTNVFQHVAVTYDKASGNAVLYYNGAAVASINLGSVTLNTTGPLLIGHRQSTGENYLGRLDEMTLYGRALSASEIAAIYNAGSAGKCSSSNGVAPMITSQPASGRVTVGGTASFAVTATGTPPLVYQWHNASGTITGATNSTLTLSNVQLSATGSYYVTVSNPYGSTNSTLAMLVVTNLPSSCTPAPSGIISWWPAEGNADDIIGGNNGIIMGGLTFAPGEVGQAFNFNTNEYISVPASPSLNVGAGGGFTIETWINPADVSVEHPLAEWNPTNGTIGTHFWIDVPDIGGGPGSVWASLIDTNNNAHWISSTTGLVKTNVFQHVAVTYDKASGNAVLYYNGTPVASINLGSVTLNTTGPLLIGHRQSTGENYLGRMDELTLYGRALSATEIAAIYNAGSAGKCSSSNGVAPMITSQPASERVTVGGTASFAVTATGTPPLMYQWHNDSGTIMGATNSTLTLSNAQFSATGSYYVTVSNPYGSTNSTPAVLVVTNLPSSCTPAPSGLVGWWRAEGNALDSIGGNNGVITGAVSFAAGEVGQAFLFTNTNEDIIIPASSNLNVGLGAGLTLEAWINPQNVTNYNPIFEWNPGDGINYWGVQMYVVSEGVYNSSPVPGTLYANVQGVGDVWHQLWSAPGTVTNGGFQHVALTYDKASGVATLYCNGAMVAQQSFGSFTPKTFDNLHIGRRPTDPAGSRFTFGGLIDEASVYNRALSQSEIESIYDAGSAGKCFVQVPPMITVQPSDETSAVGGSASFSVTAGGSPTLMYQWYNGSGSITGATNSTLTLSDVTLSAAGSYYVVVSNPYGSTNSASATLTVTNPPPPASAAPVITSFSPASSLAGAPVIITGSNFAATAAGDIVYFGAVQAVVTAGNTSTLTVIAPTNATFAVISVTVNGLTGYSDQPYLPDFHGAGPLTNTSFAPAFNLDTPNGPNRVYIADLDGDGRPDVLVANNYAGTISIFQNISSNGTLSAASFAPRVDLVVGPNGGGADPYTLAVADLDGDGKLDIVALNADDSIVSIFRNVSTPGLLTSNSFAARIDLPGGNAMRGVAVQDLDGDGRPEIVVGNSGDNNISIYKNNSTIGSMAFAPRVNLPAGSEATTVVIGDLDGDGLPDIAVANYTGSSISVFRNLGFTGTITTSSFAPAVNIPAPASPFGLALGDIDGDGKLDMVVGGNIDSMVVSVLRNTATPGSITASSFAPHVDFSLPGWANFVALADLDGDGKLDIAVVTQLGDSFSLFRNISTPGSFTTASLAPRIDLPAGYNANGVAIGDLNGDGRPDVAFANAYDNTLSIYENVSLMVTNPPPPPAPVITSINPASGIPGSTVSIIGSNFSSTAANNIVYFGAVQAAVTGASSSNLTVTLPPGATYGPITETVQGLTAESPSSFLPTFPGTSPLSESSLSNMFNLASGNGPFKVVIADIDGDGKPDLIFDNDFDATIWIYRNISTGGTLSASSFAPPVELQGASTLGPSDNLSYVAVADLDGDGRLDIVVANYYNGVVSIFQNLSSPGDLTSNSFGSRLDFSVGNNPVVVAVSDLDGDGRPDIITADNGSATISVLRNISTPGLLSSNSFAAAISFATPANPSDLAVADLDGDGKLDIVTANDSTSANAVSIFDNTSAVGTISFAPRLDLAADAAQEETVVIGDIDGDGKPDLIAGSYHQANFSVYRNIGSGGNITSNSFAAPVTFSSGAQIHRGGIAIGDIDGDGKPDLAIVGESSSSLNLYRNLSTPGSFTSASLAPPVTFTSGFNSAGVAIGDLNGDGRPDIVIANTYGNNLTVWENAVPTAGPVADASATASPVISPNGTNATVLLDGSLSHDPDGDPLQYEWIANGVAVGNGVTLQTVLPVGTNQVTLIVSDGVSSNQQTIAVQVITIVQAIQELSNLVTTDFSKAQSMAALLANAIKSVDKSNPTAAINQLQAFQNQVNAQVAPLDPALAQILDQDAQDIIDVLDGVPKTSANNLSLFVRHANGHAYLGFSGVHQQSYSIEASSDLTHWTRIGSAEEVLTGAFEFEDLSSTNNSFRFYRVVAP